MGRPPGRPPKRDVYEATESFTAEYGGVPIVVKVGDTTEQGSELLSRFPHLFRRIQVTFPAATLDESVSERVEAATAAPGEVRW